MLNKIKSVILGHAIGDALGVPVEFVSREQLQEHPVTDMIGYGTYNMPAGCWSDDTSMSLCALESLSNGSIIDYNEIMYNFSKWYNNGEFTATGAVFDIGNTCYDAIYNYDQLEYDALKCGLADERSNGNGSLMRIHPFVLFLYCNGFADDYNLNRTITFASSLTHAHSCSVDGCIIYAHILRELLNTPAKESIYNALDKIKMPNKRYHRLFDEDISVVDISDIRSGGYVVDSLEAALWCVLTTENYTECVLKAVNLGGDTDTIAAIAGGLAGALYGFDNIPKKWISSLIRKEYIENMCKNAYEKWCNKNER